MDVWLFDHVQFNGLNVHADFFQPVPGGLNLLGGAFEFHRDNPDVIANRSGAEIRNHIVLG